MDVSGAGLPAPAELRVRVEQVVASCPQSQAGFVVVHGVRSPDHRATLIGFDRSSSVKFDAEFEACVTAGLKSVGSPIQSGTFSVVVDLKPH